MLLEAAGEVPLLRGAVREPDEQPKTGKLQALAREQIGLAGVYSLL